TEPDWPGEAERHRLAYVSGLSDELPEQAVSEEEEIELASGGEESEPSVAVSGIAAPESPEPEQSRETDESEALQEAIALFNTYRSLINAQAPARLDRVVRGIPGVCETVRCADLKRAILVSVITDSASERQLLELDIRAEGDRASIDRMFRQLFPDSEAS
ncbi:MAG: hypothetical protein R3323_09045, partial [Wenzhouxiangellaceae bacterium]|nr:hypothetical protein [Wenzhouxiangellaceae bacterium]